MLPLSRATGPDPPAPSQATAGLGRRRSRLPGDCRSGTLAPSMHQTPPSPTGRPLGTLALFVCWLSLSAGGATATWPHRTETGIPYRSGPGTTEAMRERCLVDIHHPVGTNGYPTVVWFHGGGLTGGRRSVPPALREQGIAVVAAGYRLSPGTPAPGYIQDAAAAVAWTFRHIAAYGGDTNRIFVAGHSAGGYLTSMLGLDRRWLQAEGIEADALAGLIPYSGQCITHFTVRAERGIGEKVPLIDDLAPLHHVRSNATPILLITGDRHRELLGRYEENAYLWRMQKEVGHPATELFELQGYDHGGMVEPGHPLLLRFLRQVGSVRR